MIKIASIKVPHGWRGEITNDKTKEKWNSNISEDMAKAKALVISSYITYKKGVIKDKKKEIEDILAEIKDIENLKL